LGLRHELSRVSACDGEKLAKAGGGGEEEEASDWEMLMHLAVRTQLS